MPDVADAGDGAVADATPRHGHRPRTRRPADRAGGRDQRPVAHRGPRRRPHRRARAVARGAAGGRGRAAPRRPAAASRLAPRARRRRCRWTDGRRRGRRGRGDRSDACSTGSGCRSSATRSSRCSCAGSPTIRTRRPRLSPSTPRSRPTSSTPHCAARPSPTSSPSSSTSSCPTPRRSTAPARAGLEALSALAVREPLERRLGRGRARPPVPRDRAAAHPGPRPDGGDRRRPRPRRARRCSATEFATEISRLETEIYADVGHEFNLGSPKQLEQVLFFELNLPKGKRTKTGYSTDASVLEDLRAAHPMIDKLLEWRIYTKLRSTYVDALPTLIAADDRLHTTFHQAVAATGRLSSSDPNLQNIPIRTPLGRRIRRAFVAGAPDLTLVAADYSQIELRILAHVSGDEHLRDAFARGADIHRETAALVLHKDPVDVTLGERSMAKMVNFGIAYGMSDFGLSSGRTSRGPRRRTSSTRTSRPIRASATTCSPSRNRRGRRATSRRCSAASGRSPSSPRATRPCARRASGWPSTCRSRAPPPTSSRSR